MTSLKEAAVNLLIGLVLDIVIVAVLKAFTRRRRPAYDVDDQVFVLELSQFGLPMCFTCLLTQYFQDNISPLVKVATVKIVDKFSFPSGHATRATMLALLFTFLSPLPLLLWCDMINNFTSFTDQLKTADTPPEYYL